MDTGAIQAAPPGVLSVAPAWAAHEAASSVALLRQGAALFASLPAGLYASPLSVAPGGGIGRHMRHVFDVYDCFLQGAPGGCVDYARRTRDPLVESDVHAAIGAVERIVGALVRPPARRFRGSLRVRPEEGAPGEWIPSSIARELEFLRSHTVHHFAIVAVLLRSAGIEPGEEFGVAPSTLRAAASRAGSRRRSA